MIIGSVLVAAISHGPVVARVLLVLVAAAWAFALVQRIRWIWIATLVVFAFGLIFKVVSGNVRWYVAALSIIEIALLLHPLTREFYARGHERP